MTDRLLRNEESQNSSSSIHYIYSKLINTIYHFFSYNMHFFPDNDPGIPRFCLHRYCPLDHRNYLFNVNSYVIRLGYFGYDHFDKERKFYLGFASFLTLLAIGVTIYGCCALSTNTNVVQMTYWANGYGTNSSSGETFQVYIGLQSLVLETCGNVTVAGLTSCRYYSVYWSDSGCGQKTIFDPSSWVPSSTAFTSNNAILNDACQTCSNIVGDLTATTIMSCISLILVLLGAQTRMRTIADAPVQKLLGMFADTWGTLTLMFSLYLFNETCFYGIQEATMSGDAPIQMTFSYGPGFICYVICCIFGIIRGTMHWLIPLPNKGMGLCICCSDIILNKPKPPTNNAPFGIDPPESEVELRLK